MPNPSANKESAEWIGVTQAANLADVSAPAIYKAAKTGRIKSRKRGGQLLFSAVSVLRYKEDRMLAARPAA